MTIEARRKEKGMTQAELAAKLNITQQAVARWEAGNTHPRTADLPRLAAVLGVTVDELLREPEERKEGSA